MFFSFSDLHYDAAKEKEADFILDLGDTCHPKVEDRKLVEGVAAPVSE